MRCVAARILRDAAKCRESGCLRPQVEEGGGYALPALRAYSYKWEVGGLTTAKGLSKALAYDAWRAIAKPLAPSDYV